MAIFIGVIFTIKGQERFTTADYIVFKAAFLVPSIGLFINGIKKPKALQIDENGIYFNASLITSWDRYVRAYILEYGPDEGYTIKFALFVEYYDPASLTPCQLKIPLSGTLDKSIEEIECAIDEYSSAYR
ncbi:MAG: hypothetical protein ABIS01_09890 [Ferruginibacter sp.]